MNIYKYIKIITVLSSLFLISSCKTYYGDGIVGSAYTYMHLPMVKENEIVTKNYLSVQHNKDITYYEQEKNESTELSYHFSNSQQRFSYAFGGGLSFGNYEVKNLKGKLAGLNGNYNFYGAALRSKIAFNLPLSNSVHWRVIGLQAIWNIERGGFYSFKKELYSLGEFDGAEELQGFLQGIKTVTNFSVYPSTEISIKIGDSFSFTPNFALGIKLNQFTSFRAIAGLNISYKEKINIWIMKQTISPGIVRVFNDDFISKNRGDFSHFQIGIGLSF